MFFVISELHLYEIVTSYFYFELTFNFHFIVKYYKPQALIGFSQDRCASDKSIWIAEIEYIFKGFFHCDLVVYVPFFSEVKIKSKCHMLLILRDLSLTNNKKETIGLAESHYQLPND